jgi:hypothetical protein
LAASDDAPVMPEFAHFALIPALLLAALQAALPVLIALPGPLPRS